MLSDLGFWEMSILGDEHFGTEHFGRWVLDFSRSWHQNDSFLSHIFALKLESRNNVTDRH